MLNAPYLNPMPWRRFMEFLSLDADRFSIVKELLEENKINFSVFEVAGNRHIIAVPEHTEKVLNRPPPTILVAHYDRAEGSPGANDNSVGVFMLIETAVKLKKRRNKNWVIIFSDKEELKTGESLETQGAYALAAGIKKAGMENSKIFCFDSCGTGDTIVFSTTIEHLLKKEEGREKQLRSILELRDYALGCANVLKIDKVILTPTLFSDDVGFFKGGLAAQTITMLPSVECKQLVVELRKNPEFANVLINAELQRKMDTTLSIPVTWRHLNTPKDTHLRLTPKNFSTVIRFAESLCLD